MVWKLWNEASQVMIKLCNDVDSPHTIAEPEATLGHISAMLLSRLYNNALTRLEHTCSRTNHVKVVRKNQLIDLCPSGQNVSPSQWSQLVFSWSEGREPDE